MSFNSYNNKYLTRKTYQHKVIGNFYVDIITEDVFENESIKHVSAKKSLLINNFLKIEQEDLKDFDNILNLLRDDFSM